MKQLFGKDIDLQQFGCSGFGNKPQPQRPFVNLYVKVTDACNAHCRFCSNAGNKPVSAFNLEKFKTCVEEITSSEIRLNRICLTGGEPSMKPMLAEEIIDYIESNKLCELTQLQLNTNGLTSDSLRLMHHNRLDVISVSLHHYQHILSKEIFRCEIPGHMGGYPGVNRAKLNVSCNLVRGYIDCAEEVEKYLRYVASMGIVTVGFVSLMKLNHYCREHFIDFSEIDWDAIPHLYKVGEKEHANHCKCRNYVYDSSHGMINVYMRETVNPEYCGSSLLYDGAYLRQGFNKNNIIY